MALITCPECGREKVSNTAIACPSCGFAIREYFEKIEINKQEQENQEKNDKLHSLLEEIENNDKGKDQELYRTKLKALADEYNYNAAYLKLAFSYLESRDYELAAQFVEKASVVPSELSDFEKFNVAKIYDFAELSTKKGRYSDKTVEYFESVGNAYAFFRIARYYDRTHAECVHSKDKDKAREYYNKSVEEYCYESENPLEPSTVNPAVLASDLAVLYYTQFGIDYLLQALGYSSVAIKLDNANSLMANHRVIEKKAKEHFPQNYQEMLKAKTFKDVDNLAHKINMALKEKEIAVRCPKCGSTSITTGARGVNQFWGFLGASQTVNRCANCGFTWNPKFK